MKNYPIIIFLVFAGLVAQAQSQSRVLGKSSDYANELLKIRQSRLSGAYQVPFFNERGKKSNATIHWSYERNGETVMVGGTNHITSNLMLRVDQSGRVSGEYSSMKDKKAWKYDTDESGSLVLTTEDIHDKICVEFVEEAEEDFVQEAEIAEAQPDLQSLPGSRFVVYIDMDGEVSRSRWANGQTINAQPMGFTQDQMRQVWELVAEDFIPFDLNVTTNRAVYDATPFNRRMMCICTPTNTAAPGAGGVAYINSFSWNEDVPCWTFNRGVKGCAETTSHEVGHTLGLRHDGLTNGTEYYSGHGNWAPIMGNSMSRAVTQWSRGEYANANNTQDDLNVMTTSHGFTYRVDDAGNTIQNARTLTVSTTGQVLGANNRGIIERNTDVDMFRFTTSAAGTVNLTINPHPTYPNLNIRARLLNSTGGVIATSDPTNSMAASFNTALNAAGTYFISVEGVGDGASPSVGYSAYNSMGVYTIQGTIPSPNQSPVANFTTDRTQVCQGGNIIFTDQSTNNPTSWSWTFQGGTPATSNQRNPTVTFNQAGTFNVTLVATNSFGSNTVTRQSLITVTANPSATITTTQPTSICQGGSVTLNANTGTGLTYVWTRDNTTLTTTTSTLTASTAGAYRVRVTNANGCSTTSNPTTVSVNTNPIATISTSQPTTFCQGGSVVLNANTGTGLTYSWTRDNTTLTTTTATLTASTAGAYRVRVTNANGCSTTSNPTTVTVNANPTAIINTTQPTTFCQGGSVALNANTGTGLTYSWTRNNTTLTTTTANLTASTSGAYSVRVTNANGCSTTSDPTNVTVNSNPTATISTTQPTTICQGGSVALNANTGTGLTYVWTRDNTTLTTTTATLTASTAGAYSVRVTNANGCSTTSNPTTVTVNANPTATISTTQPTTFCQSGSVALNANTGTGLSYVWTRDNTTLTTTTATLTASTAGAYRVRVTNANGCSTTSNPTTVTVNPNPVANLSAERPTTFCEGDSVTLTANTGSGLTYVWTRNNSTLSNTTSSLVAKTTGDYTVRVRNVNNCESESEIISVKVNSNPTVELSQTGTIKFCEDASPLLSATENEFFRYSWTKNNQPVENPSSQLTIEEEGIYRVRVIDSNACEGISSTANFQKVSLPNANLKQSGTISLCDGDSTKIEAVEANQFSYFWIKDNFILDDNKPYLVVRDSGQYSLEVETAEGCRNISETVIVSLLARSEWFEDRDNDGFGNPLVSVMACEKPNGFVNNKQDDCDENSNKINPGQCGCERAEDCFDCHGTAFGSAEIDACNVCAGGLTGISPNNDPMACVTSLLNNGNTSNINVSPNPFSNQLKIESAIPVDYELFDMSGAKVMQGETGKYIDTSSLPCGIYALVIRGLTFVNRITVVKQ